MSIKNQIVVGLIVTVVGGVMVNLLSNLSISDILNGVNSDSTTVVQEGNPKNEEDPAELHLPKSLSSAKITDKIDNSKCTGSIDDHIDCPL